MPHPEHADITNEYLSQIVAALDTINQTLAADAGALTGVNTALMQIVRNLEVLVARDNIGRASYRGG